MLIIHRCQTCGKPDVFSYRNVQGAEVTPYFLTCRYEGRRPKKGGCGGKGWGPPELMRRWKFGTTEEITMVEPPGGRSSTVAVTTCTCDECWNFYTAQTGIERVPA